MLFPSFVEFAISRQLVTMTSHYSLALLSVSGGLQKFRHFSIASLSKSLSWFKSRFPGD